MECGWDQIMYLGAVGSVLQFLAVTHKPGAALGSWGKQDAHEGYPVKISPFGVPGNDWPPLPLYPTFHSVKCFTVEQLQLSCCLSALLIAQGRLVTAIYIAGCEINALPCQLIAQIAGDRLTECWGLSARWRGAVVAAGVECGRAGPISVAQLCEVIGAFWRTTTSLSNT